MAGYRQDMSRLAERLGYPADAKLLVLHADELGLCHAVNIGAYTSLRAGIATSASLMIPSPWARAAAATYRGDDIGVRLTVNAEHDHYRWGPITPSPSLLDGDGGFPRTIDDLWEHGDVDEIRRECRAQIERAILWGFDVSHLDAHLGAVMLRPEFFDVYLELAVEFCLPIRLPNQSEELRTGFPFRKLAAEEGIVVPDRLIASVTMGDEASLLQAVTAIEPGVTELSMLPAVDTPELRAVTTDWQLRSRDYHLLMTDSPLARAIAETGAIPIGFRRLRELMRHTPPQTPRTS